MEVFCPKCGMPVENLETIYTESWEDDGITLTGKQAYKVRSINIPAYCTSCISSLTWRRMLATILAALPLWLFGAVSVVLNGGGAVLVMGLYALYLFKTLEYSWADKVVYGWELEENLRSKTTVLRPDVASVMFPTGCLYSIGRAVFFTVSAFFMSFLAGFLILGSAGRTGGHPPAEETVQTENMTPLEISEFVIHSLEFGGLDKLKKVVNDQPKILEYRDQDGATLLHLAARTNNREGVKFLLDKGLKIGTLDQAFAFTPLHYAARSGKAESAKVLIERGASVNVVGKGGKTPLFVAVENRRYEVCELLIKRGANVQVKTERGLTPLGIAKTNRYGELISLLQKSGANE